MFVITGGGSGIGAALAHSLASRKKKVLIVGRRQSALEETSAFSEAISICSADITTSAGRSTLLTKLQPIQQIEGLIHNAGIIGPILPLAEIEEKSWHQVLETNLNAPLFLSQALLPKLRGGRVLHIGSGAAYFPISSWGSYCVSKAGLSMLTRCWQMEEKAVAFASVMPGIIDTDMQAFIRASTAMEKTKLDFFQTLKRENKLLSKETVAAFLTWLLLDVPKEDYCLEEWDIYSTNHHHNWLKPPHIVPALD